MLARFDHRIISQIIEPHARVLDLGCGDGELMQVLAQGKQAIVQGIELNDAEIYKCVAKGLSVFHDDIDSGLPEYPDQSFDYVILNQSMQEVKRIDKVIDDALRVGEKVIVSFPNFAYIKDRLMLFFQGKAPISKSLPYHWYDTPNLRFLSISDFKKYCRLQKINILRQFNYSNNSLVRFWPNLLAQKAIFVIQK